jgi:hypothetical protein
VSSWRNGAVGHGLPRRYRCASRDFGNNTVFVIEMTVTKPKNIELHDNKCYTWTLFKTACGHSVEAIESERRGIPALYACAKWMRNGLCTCNEKKVDEDMRRVTTNRNTLKRLDALIALPLAQFRRALTGLTPEELEALQARIAVQSVKSRWARGGHGLARHRSVHELGLLARRREETRRERETRRGAVAQLRLVETAPTMRELAPADLAERAA